MDLEHAEDASPANRVASGLHFRPQAMRAVVLTSVTQILRARLLVNRIRAALLPMPRTVCGRYHAQRLVEGTHRHVGGPLGNVLISAHRVG